MSKNNKVKWVIIILICIAGIVGGTFLINHICFRHEEGLVFATEYGECYHTIDCHHLRYSWIPIGIEQAQKLGLRACVDCGGHAKGEIEVNDYETSAWISISIVGSVCGICCYLKYKN